MSYFSSHLVNQNQISLFFGQQIILITSIGRNRMVFIEEVVETPPSPPPTPPLASNTKSNGLHEHVVTMNKRLFGSHNWSEEVAMACDNFKSPFVLWAQSGDHIFLKIDVQDSLQPRIKIGEHSIDVLTEATGASGVSIYRAHIDLLHNVVEKVGCRFVD